jgi:hypothetical protein
MIDSCYKDRLMICLQKEFGYAVLTINEGRHKIRLFHLKQRKPNDKRARCGLSEAHTTILITYKGSITIDRRLGHDSFLMIRLPLSAAIPTIVQTPRSQFDESSAMLFLLNRFESLLKGIVMHGLHFDDRDVLAGVLERYARAHLEIQPMLVIARSVPHSAALLYVDPETLLTRKPRLYLVSDPLFDPDPKSENRFAHLVGGIARRAGHHMKERWGTPSPRSTSILTPQEARDVAYIDRLAEETHGLGIPAYDPPLILKIAEALKALRVLHEDTVFFHLGVGDGRLCAMIAKLFFARAAGPEPNAMWSKWSLALKETLEGLGLLPENRLRFKKGALLQGSWQHYDAIFYSFHWMETTRQRKIVNKLLRELKIGGRCIVQGLASPINRATYFPDLQPLIDSGEFFLERASEWSIWVLTRLSKRERVLQAA